MGTWVSRVGRSSACADMSPILKSLRGLHRKSRKHQSLRGKKNAHIGPTKRSQHTLADSFGRVKGIDLSVAIRQISELSIWRGENALPGRGLPF